MADNVEDIIKLNGYDNDNETNGMRALRLSLYMTLKNLHDKWLTSYNRDRFTVNDPYEERRQTKDKLLFGDPPKSEFSNFIYVDSFYNDIGDRLLMNPQTMYNYIKDHRDYKDGANLSTYQIMARLCEDNKLIFITLPIFNNYNDPNFIVNMFRPTSDMTMKVGDMSTYLVMYTHNISHVLPNRDEDKFRNDGFDIADVTGEISPDAITLFKEEDTEEGRAQGRDKLNVKIPAFGVTFARQNQSIFKNITVNMESPKLTDYSISNMFKIARMTGAGGAYEKTTQMKTIAQDAYSVFANQSYTCTVEMLGCMNIMPMMYFQLNNVPMFRGAYMIISVKHDIKAGNMTTKFTGVRVSKIRKEFVNNTFLLSPFVQKLIGNDAEEIKRAILKEYGVMTTRRNQRLYSESELNSNIWSAPKDMTTWMIPEDCKEIDNVRSVLSKNVIWERGKIYKVGKEDAVGFSMYAVIYWICKGFKSPYDEYITFCRFANLKNPLNDGKVMENYLGFPLFNDFDTIDDLKEFTFSVGDVLSLRLLHEGQTVYWYAMYDGKKFVSDIIHDENILPNGYSIEEGEFSKPIKLYRYSSVAFTHGEMYKQVYNDKVNNTKPSAKSHFTLKQLTVTTHKNVNNNPNNEERAHLKELCENILDPLYEATEAEFGGIVITSAFRSKALNKVVGGSETSAHLEGYAADIKPAKKGTVDELYDFMKRWWLKDYDFDQLIDEYETNGSGKVTKRWVHIGYKNREGDQRRETFKMNNHKRGDNPISKIPRR